MRSGCRCSVWKCVSIAWAIKQPNGRLQVMNRRRWLCDGVPLHMTEMGWSPAPWRFWSSWLSSSLVTNQSYASRYVRRRFPTCSVRLMHHPSLNDWGPQGVEMGWWWWWWSGIVSLSKLNWQIDSSGIWNSTRWSEIDEDCRRMDERFTNQNPKRIESIEVRPTACKSYLSMPVILRPIQLHIARQPMAMINYVWRCSTDGYK